jgi:hypothetical protein
MKKEDQEWCAKMMLVGFHVGQSAATRGATIAAAEFAELVHLRELVANLRSEVGDDNAIRCGAWDELCEYMDSVKE